MFKSRIRNFLKNDSYIPSFFSPLWSPFYFARKGLADEIIASSSQLSGRLLDVGCGTVPYKLYFSHCDYVALDIDSAESRKRNVADFLYNGGRFPFEDSTYDSVFTSQVLEHVFNPNEFLLEIHRILKPGGKLLLTVPFVWDEHEQPFDYARYSSFGLRDLLEKTGFTVIKHKKIGADVTTLFQLTNAYFYKITQNWPRVGRWVFTVTAIALVNIIGVFASKLLPKNPDLYLDHVVFAEKVV